MTDKPDPEPTPGEILEGVRDLLTPPKTVVTPETLKTLLDCLLAAIRRGDEGSIAEARYIINNDGYAHASAWKADLAFVYEDGTSMNNQLIAMSEELRVSRARVEALDGLLRRGQHIVFVVLVDDPNADGWRAEVEAALAAAGKKP